MTNDNDRPSLRVIQPTLPGVPEQLRDTPTKAVAFLTLHEAAKQFAERQTDATFERLAAAVQTARLLKLY